MTVDLTALDKATSDLKNDPHVAPATKAYGLAATAAIHALNGTAPTPPAPAPAAGLDARYPATLRTLYDSWKPPASPTKTVTTQAALDALTVVAGDWVLVQPLPGGAAYTGQRNWTWQFPAGKISAKVQFAPGVKFLGPAASDPNIESLFNIVGTTGVLFEGAADVSNPGWNCINMKECVDVIVRGVIAHGGATSGISVSADTTGTRNTWLVECEAYNNGHNAACWNGYGPDFYLKGAHGVNFGDANGPTVGGGVIGCKIHDQHTGYGVQLYGHADSQTVDFNTLTNVDGKVSGNPPVVGTASDEAGCGIMAYGTGVTNLLVGAGNTYSGCAFTDFALEAGATLAPGSAQPTYTA